MPIRVIVTQGTTADCTQAAQLIEGLSAEHLLADKGYDSDAIVEQATAQGMSVVIPPRKNRKEQRSYDNHLYRHRHLVENAFLHLKRWRGTLPATLKTPHHSWLQSAYAILRFGSLSHDDTV